MNEATQLADDNITDSNTAAENNEPAEKVEEFEISLDTPDSTRKNNPMVNRIIGQRDKARDENAELRQKVQELEAKFSKPEPKPLPKLVDFSTDEEYERAIQNHYAQNALNSQPKINPIEEFQKQQNLNNRLDKHYQKATALAEKFPEYSKAEEAATQILGDAIAQEVATRTTNSAELMLYLGSNPHEAQRFKNLANNDPVQAGIELGRLDAKVKVQSKVKQPTPEPDEILESKAGIQKNQRGPEGATFE